ncbi:hypothetical protein SAMN05216466_110175 [Paraburkholderia phenazinium]|uniref:Uncharacterized protein n=1 Tax=Paraburkholderia phenazinium TaxID=60549 RepID=A0A1G8CXS2_9BURK|nr:hypothetical protein SAMN05216466_110175 [Paraburkholderia phenazinium]
MPITVRQKENARTRHVPSRFAGSQSGPAR